LTLDTTLPPLLLVRHGVTDWNREGRFQGHLDPPLCDPGRRQARLLGARLAGVGPRPDVVIASPLGRALETAQLIVADLLSRNHTVTMTTDDRLMEIGQGDWEGRTHAELAVEDAERYAAWRRRGSDLQPPNAEPIEDARRRVATFLADALPPLRGRTVCLVSHGGILRLAARELLALSVERTWSVDVDNASLSQLLPVDDGVAEPRIWRLVSWNDVRHLLGQMPTHVDESEGEPLAL
jgi:probable phosphoglycerate mutase